MEAIINNLIKATGWSIFHSIWQGAIIYALLLLAVNLFPRMQSRSKHNIAYGSLVLLFVVFAITFVSIFELPSAAVPKGASSIEIANSQQSSHGFGWLSELNDRAENMFPLLVAIYAIGLIVQLIILSKGYAKLSILKKKGLQSVPESWELVFESLLGKLGLRQQVNFKLSALVNVPIVVGYLKPIVLFPIALVAQLEINQVEAILIHELSHIRRNDYLLNLIKTAVETILFFNPFVWLCSKLIGIEREHACDDLVLSLTGTPVTYAHALLKLEILKEKGSPAFSMAATGNNHHLYQRIKRITDMKTNYSNSKQQLFAVALTMATILSLAWVSPREKEKITLKVTEVKKVQDIKIGSINRSISNEIIIDTIPSKSTKIDTAKKKRTMKITTVDANGNKVVYNSVSEMPDSLRLKTLNDADFDFKQFSIDLKESFKGMDTIMKEAFAFTKSPEYVKELKESLAYMKSPGYAKEVNEAFAYIRSPEFQKEMKNSAEATREYFTSPDWKKQQLEIVKNAEEFKKTFNSKEFKALQQKQLQESRELRLKYSGDGIKKDIEALRELKSSEEYKLLKEKFDKDLEKLKEKKGIKTDLKIGSLNTIEISSPAAKN
jgi:bla regulator protein BlaR1